LIEPALGHDYEGLERTIDGHVHHIRRKIEAGPAHPPADCHRVWGGLPVRELKRGNIAPEELPYVFERF